MSLLRVKIFLSIFILLVLVSVPTIARSTTCNYGEPELDVNVVRNYVKNTYSIASGSDALIDSALSEYSSFSAVSPFLDLFKILIRADGVACDISNGDYHAAIATGMTYATELAISDTLIGGTLLSVLSVASLAALPVQLGLENFMDSAITTAWNNQTSLYIWARTLGYSHQFIMNGVSDDTILFTDDGWLYIVGDKQIPSYGPVRPGDYTREQVFGAAQSEYSAYFATATYPRDKDQIGDEFLKLINPAITYTPSLPAAPVDVTFTVSGSLLSEMNIVSYSWDFGDGHAGSGPTVTHFYKIPQSYNVTLQLTDDAGQTHTYTETLVVRPPAINVSYPDGYESLKRGFSTPLTSYATQYTWNFGDGYSVENDREHTHTYATGGSYWITLTLTLDDDSTITAQVPIFVGPGTQYIPGHTIYNSETWYSGGTYVVQGPITVAEGATLTIQEGAEVRLGTYNCSYVLYGTPIWVYGTLNATGAKFTWADEQNQWGSIFFSGPGSSGSRLDSCIFEHASGFFICYWGYDPNPFSVIYISNSSPTITGCTITNNNNVHYGIVIEKGAPIISNNTISGLSTGIAIRESFPTVTGNKFINNGTGISYEYRSVEGQVFWSRSGGFYQGNIFNGNYVGMNADCYYAECNNNHFINGNVYSDNSDADLVFSGNFNESTLLNVNATGAKILKILWGLEIEENGSLTFPKNATIKITEGAQIEVYGVLKAVGGKFIGVDEEEFWGCTFNFMGTSSSGSLLENCKFEHLYRPIGISDSSPEIKGCTFYNSTGLYGISIGSSASPTIKDNTISGFSGSGIIISGNSKSPPSSFPTVTGNTITGNKRGISISYQSGTFRENTIAGNTEYGLYSVNITTIIDAINNDWGDVSGPLDNSDDRASGGWYNPTGLGNKVSDKVEYYPWTGTTICETTTPTGLSGVPTVNEITLNWHANSEDCLGGYKIYYGTASGNYWTPRIVGNVTSYKLTGLSSGTSYYIVISSMNSVGMASPKSTEIMVRTDNVYSISGYVVGDNQAGVSMTLSGGISIITTTDSAGSYSFSGLSNGAYTVTPSKPGYSFTPPSTNVTVSGANVTGVNFVASVPTLIGLSSFTAATTNKYILLKWTTASEIDNAGFNLYRSESGDGEYVKINSSLIPAEGTSTSGATYKYVDNDVQNRKTYYYKLEDIDLHGKSTMHGPVSVMPSRLGRD
jgi:parallel beta-helix repeat protein